MWLYRLNHVLGPLLGLYWRLELRGRVESIPPAGPLILAANHASYLDPWLIGMVFPRPVRYLMTHTWYDRSPLWRAAFRAFGTEPVREDDPQATLQAVGAVLARGEVAGIFPEGSVSENGRLRRFRAGIARIAAQSGAPVLPVGIRGGFQTLPKHRRLPQPSKVVIEVGEPIRFPGAPRAEPSREELRAFRDRLFEAVRAASGHGEARASR